MADNLSRNHLELSSSGGTLTPFTRQEAMYIAMANNSGGGGGGGGGGINIANNAGAHNSIYRGLNLGNEVTSAQYDVIDAGTFDDIFIGDYWTINGINWRVAALDYWFGFGKADSQGTRITVCTTHHVAIVPDTCIVTDVQMNSTNVVTGAYMGSNYYTGTNNNTGRNDAGDIIRAAFGNNHLLAYPIVLHANVSSQVAIFPSYFLDAAPAESMNEIMVYGCKVYGNQRAGTAQMDNSAITYGQLPLFRYNRSHIIADKSWWLRDVANSTGFCSVDLTGTTNYNNASDKIGIRPAFAICKGDSE